MIYVLAAIGLAILYFVWLISVKLGWLHSQMANVLKSLREMMPDEDGEND